MSDINILSIHPITRRVTYTLNLVPKRAEGMECLLQLCVKTILTTNSTDKFSPLYGGSLNDFVSKGISTYDIPALSADIVHVVSKAQSQIIYEQTNTSIPKDEKLRSMTILSIGWNEDYQSLDVNILVKSMTGEESEINLGNQIRVGRS